LQACLINAAKLERFNSKALTLFASHSEDLTHTAAAGTQAERSRLTPDQANSRSFSPRDASSGAIVAEQCMKALRLSIPTTVYTMPPGVPLLNV